MGSWDKTLVIGANQKEANWLHALDGEQSEKAAPARRAVRWLVDSVKALVPSPKPDAPMRAVAGHAGRRMVVACPIPGCGGQWADCYDDHGGLCVCAECGATFDPSMEVAGEGVA